MTCAVPSPSEAGVRAEGRRPARVAGGWWRCAWRAPSAIGYSAGLWALWTLAETLARPWPRARRRLRGVLFRSWARGLLPLFGLEVEVRGARPPAPCLYVSNHLGYVDVLVLASQLDCVFVAKTEIAAWPFAGALASSMHTIYVDREQHRDLPRVNAAICAALADELTVVLFPEGQSSDGARVLPFKSPLFESAVQLGVPVWGGALRYTGPPGRPPASEIVAFWGEIGFVAHLVRLLRSPGGWRATLTLGAAPIAPRDRKQLARELHAAVAALHEPMP